MKRTVFWVAATLAVSGSAFALAAAAESDQPSHAERMRHWAADRETMLDAKLAGMKAGLQLTSDQDKLWVPFEVRGQGRREGAR